MAKRGSDVDAKIDALFQRSLGEFTGARNALAQQLRKEGRRSVNNGNTWTNVQNNLPWHAIDSAVRPNGYVYALTEGSGLWGSSTMGNSWIPPNPATPSLGVSLLMDPATPTRLYAGRLNGGTQTGGIFRSIDAGNTFQPVGLKGATVSEIALMER